MRNGSRSLGEFPWPAVRIDCERCEAIASRYARTHERNARGSTPRRETIGLEFKPKSFRRRQWRRQQRDRRYSSGDVEPGLALDRNRLQ
jgi:hypothetical protein